MTREVCILGVGSPHGDDQAGWHLIERLGSQSHLGADAIAISDPSDIVHHLDGSRPAVIVDACESGRSPGTITRLEWPPTRIAPPAGRSTHALSVWDALELASQLGRLPRSVVIFAVEIEQCQPGRGLSPALQRALPALGRRVLEQVREFRQTEPGDDGLQDIATIEGGKT